MATFYNASQASLGTGDTTVVTSTSNSTIVLSILVANRDRSFAADITTSHKDASDVIQNYLAFTIPVPADANVELLSSKYILPSGEKLVAKASSASDLDIAVSYVEV